MAFSGKTLASITFEEMPSLPRLNNSIFEVNFSVKIIIDKRKHYVRATYTPLDPELPETITYLFYNYSKHLDLPKPEVKLSYENGVLIARTETFSMFTHLYICGEEDPTLHLSDNYFHLSPRWPVTVEVLSAKHKAMRGGLLEKICIRTVYDA